MTDPDGIARPLSRADGIRTSRTVGQPGLFAVPFRVADFLY